MDATKENFQKLVVILQLAYSGELAAGLAYRGHSRTVKSEEERTRIQQIENEEWHHRNLVGSMLSQIGKEPDRSRETRALLIGRILSLLCHLIGWFAPMYAAGKLESRNIREYESAARYATGCGHPEFVECLLAMAEVEWEHERYFRLKVIGHPWIRWFRIWPSPPEKEEIRRSFSKEFPLVTQPSQLQPIANFRT